MGTTNGQVSEPVNDDGRNNVTSQKARDILEACKWRNTAALQALAATDCGFMTDDLRRQAWPVLLGVPFEKDDLDDARKPQTGGDWKELPRHRDEDQVQLDVNRSFIYYPNNQTEAELDHRKRELSDLITEVLRRYPYLCYFQGYHDICQVFLLVLSAPLRAPSLARLSALRIRDFMLTSLDPTVDQLRLIPDILAAADPSLKHYLAGTEPFYALAGTLTMYAHDIQAYGDIARLFDVLLAREPVFSVYMFASIVLSRRDELVELAQDPDNDPALLHLALSKVPQHMDLERLIADTSALFAAHPPSSLPAWRRRISEASCLKTARDLDACTRQTMQDGEALFHRQLNEPRAAERRKKILATLWAYRRGAGAVGVAVLVGLAAVYLRRTTAGSGPLGVIGTFVTRWANSTAWTYKF
ncbi:GTPase-activating protein gyp10 like [Verticillium longisporum]|nr:GTPase-activating protein gyp10 like [Verticillium longisporum]